MNVLKKIALSFNRLRLQHYYRIQEKIPELEEMLSNPEAWEKKKVLEAAWKYLIQLEKMDPVKVSVKQLAKMQRFVESAKDETLALRTMEFAKKVMQALLPEAFSSLMVPKLDMNEIAERLGGTLQGEVEATGGYFGAASLAGKLNQRNSGRA